MQQLGSLALCWQIKTNTAWLFCISIAPPTRIQETPCLKNWLTCLHVTLPIRVCYILLLMPRVVNTCGILATSLIGIIIFHCCTTNACVWNVSVKPCLSNNCTLIIVNWFVLLFYPKHVKLREVMGDKVLDVLLTWYKQSLQVLQIRCPCRSTWMRNGG